MCFPPQQRTSAHLLLVCPSFHKVSTGECVRCRIVLSGMQLFSLYFFTPPQCFHLCPLLPFILWWISVSLSFLCLLQSTAVNSVCLGQVWECRFAAFTGRKQSNCAVITCWRACACDVLSWVRADTLTKFAQVTRLVTASHTQDLKSFLSFSISLNRQSWGYAKVRLQCCITKVWREGSKSAFLGVHFWISKDYSPI